mmetsp:Transcript_29589/g.66321  ORF Transcript_29589/g.66321 Transcript_29589/m.66321 type:complete len:258 (+) Transcript_29589:304-1077(+)
MGQELGLGGAFRARGARRHKAVRCENGLQRFEAEGLQVLRKCRCVEFAPLSPPPPRVDRQGVRPHERRDERRFPPAAFLARLGRVALRIRRQGDPPVPALLGELGLREEVELLGLGAKELPRGQGLGVVLQRRPRGLGLRRRRHLAFLLRVRLDGLGVGALEQVLPLVLLAAHRQKAPAAPRARVGKPRRERCLGRLRLGLGVDPLSPAPAALCNRGSPPASRLDHPGVLLPRGLELRPQRRLGPVAHGEKKKSEAL